MSDGPEAGRSWSLERVLELRDQIERRDRSAPIRDERYHGASALVSWFELTPDRYTGAAAANLIADSLPVDEQGTRWMLKNNVRRRVLKQLGTRSALQEALGQTAVRPADLLQFALEACLAGSLKPLGSQTSQELAASMQVIDWLGVTELKESLPAAEAVQERIEYANLLDPLKALAGTNFVGRKNELATLARYVDSDQSGQPPLLIFGPGGMGKSSLLARFVLDRIAQRDFVYLDFDRPGLSSQEPITLLAEAVRQLGLQRPESRAAAERLRTDWLRGIALSHAGNASTRGRSGELDEFVAFVTDLGLVHSTILLAIDTFEEVQYRSRTEAIEVSLFLDQLRERLPKLRTVIAGRNPAPEFKALPLELGELDQEASQGLLGSLGVESVEVQRRLARLLHGNPLSLRLAVELLEVDDAKGLDDLEGLTDDTVIQGVLYGRVLGHIHLDSVRQIAHPGLILRRITADIIREVLAEPCGLSLASPAQADSLFTLLRGELSLVIPEGDAVRHRPDVRRVMLEPLRRDRKDVVRRIEEAAIAYYLPFTDVTSRAEEIYHRLSTGQSRELIDPRWMPGIEDSLRSAIDEVPPGTRAYLAAKIGVELYDQNWDDVDQQTWEDHVARQAGDLLKVDRPLDAVYLLRRRSARLPGSPVYWLHAQALRRAGQVLESREVASQALEPLLPHGAPMSPALVDWFTGPELRGAPSRGEVGRQAARFEVLEPLRTMTALFVDREQEAEALGAYVFSREPMLRPPLLVVGGAGVGKTALVAKYIITKLAELDPVYINLNSFPPRPEPSDGLDRVWVAVYQQLCLIRPELRTLGDGRRIDPGTLHDCLAAMRDAARPLLVVIDGLERLQAERPDDVRELFTVLAELRQAASHLRFVIVSRARPDDQPLEIVELRPFSYEVADLYLKLLGTVSPDHRRRLIAIAGTSPRTLEMAVAVVRESGVESIDQMTEADIAPSLLGHVLENLEDPQLKRLAEGALLLRRVTADVIERVLAGPCRVAVENQARAWQWLERLQRETALFELVDSGVIRSRPDVRQVVRLAMSGRDPQFTRAVDEAAIGYYEPQTDPELRSEEIFHRIMAGQAVDDIAPRWIDGVEPFLQDLASQVSGSMRTYLAARLGFSDVDIDLETADQTTWEAYVSHRATSLIRLGRLPQTLDLLRQRSERMRRSPLYAIEAQVLLSMGRAREALVVGRRGLELWPDDPRLPGIVAAAEAAVGPGEAAVQQPAAERGRGLGFYLLERVALPLLAETLRVALPSATDVINAFRTISGMPRVLSSADLPDLVHWADENGRLDELVSAAAAYAPTNPDLKAFLAVHAKRVEAAAADPITDVVLQHGEVFLNRQPLRDFLRGLVTGDARSRVLVVNGPRGSGKSYTGVLADSVARTTGRLEYRHLELSGLQSGMALIGSIFDAFQWRGDMISPSAVEQMRRHFAGLANIIRRKAEESRAAVLLHLDVSDQPRSDTLEFLAMLVHEPGRLALILSGFRREWLSPADAPYVLSEDLGDLTVEDIEDALSRIFRQNGRAITDEQLRDVAASVMSRLAPGEYFNRRCNYSIKQVLATLSGTGAV